MALQRRGGSVSVRGIVKDPRIGKVLTKLQNALPAVTFGDQFPAQAQVGDEHFYTGEDSTEYKKNNWYKFNSIGTWTSVSGDVLQGSNIRGDIPSGVTIADYLSLFGGKMEGVIDFHEDQQIPGSSIIGDIPSGVTIADYFKKTGGQITGNVNLTDKNISRLGRLSGKDSAIYIDMATDGEMTIEADSEINLITASLLIIANAILTGDLEVSGTIEASNFGPSGNVDQDVSEGAAPSLDASNFENYNLVCDEDSTLVYEGEAVWLT